MAMARKSVPKNRLNLWQMQLRDCISFVKDDISDVIVQLEEVVALLFDGKSGDNTQEKLASTVERIINVQLKVRGMRELIDEVDSETPPKIKKTRFSSHTIIYGHFFPICYAYVTFPYLVEILFVHLLFLYTVYYCTLINFCKVQFEKKWSVSFFLETEWLNQVLHRDGKTFYSK